MENTIRRFLVVIEGPNAGQAYPLQDMVCTIGRTADNTIVIDSTRISRHHTQIRLAEGTTGTTAIVEDMGSTNGTWVNHRQLTGPHRLMPGDVVTLADYITFQYEVEDALSTAKLIPTMPDSATQMMNDSTPYPPPPPPPDYEEPYRTYSESPIIPPQQPLIQFDSASQTASASQPTPAPQQAWTAPPPPPPAAPPARRSKWIYVIVAILLVLICICLGIAIYLWFAPVTFWESVFDLFNIPLP
ncbi:MAG: FHA domain-containing protein [Anaerolineae bacterium]|nr:FHA domain-containing protein [Anaerolineae bacterium]